MINPFTVVFLLLHLDPDEGLPHHHLYGLVSRVMLGKDFLHYLYFQYSHLNYGLQHYSECQRPHVIFGESQLHQVQYSHLWCRHGWGTVPHSGYQAMGWEISDTMKGDET